MSKISVIIPIYNALDDVKILLESLLTNFNFNIGEIILVNDCSLVETTDYLNDFAKEHTNFKLITNEENLGFVKSCNKGMKASTGDIVVLLNSDTKIPSEFCERIIKCFETNPKVGVASPISSHSWLFYISLPKNLTLEQMNERLRKNHKCTYPLIHAAEGFCFCIRKQVIEQQGYLDEIYGKGYHEEVDFAYRAITNGWQNVLIDDLYVYHKRHASFGISEREKQLQKNDAIYLSRWGGFKEKYEKEHNLKNPINKIKREMFPFKTFFSNLFSIKNSYDKRHKIVTILGVKVKMKRKNKKRLLVHFHLYYHEQIDFFLKNLKNINHCNWDLYVTYTEDNKESKKKLLQLKPDTHFIKTTNAGYDILPFYKVLKAVDLTDYDYILKIHTKGFRTINNIFGTGFLWRDALVNSLLGSKSTFYNCLRQLQKDLKIGIISAKKCIIDINTRNQPEDTYLFDEVCQKFNLPNTRGFFIAGTMFICRANLMNWFKNLDIKETEFSSECEQTGMNGKPIHVLERLLSTMITNQGYEIYGMKEYIPFSKRLKKFMQKILSVKNEGEHKIFRFLGVKISCKHNHNALNIQKKEITRYLNFVNTLNKDKKSILFISHNVSMTGAPLAVYNTAKYFQEKGYNTVIISYGNSKIAKDLYIQKCKDANICCFESELFNTDEKFIETMNHFDYIFVNCAYSYKIVNKIPPNKNYLWRMSEADLIKNNLSLIPEFITAVKKCKKLFAVSELTQNELLPYNKDTKLLLYGIKDVCTQYKKDTDDTKIKFIIIGNWCHRKAQYLAIYALDLLPQNIKNKVELVFLGENNGNISTTPDYFAYFKILGVLDGDEKYQAIANCDVCLCPSIDDPNPQAVMEAMMMKKPCIVTDKVGQAKYITDKEDGIVIPVADSRAIAKAIEFFVENPDKINEMGLKSYELYKKYFSYDKYINQVLDILEISE